MRSAPILLFWVFSFFSFAPPSSSLPVFATNNVTLSGDAHFADGSISLTREFNRPYPSPAGIGTAFYVFPIRFLDPPTATVASFSTRFTFRIVASNYYPFGDGFTFLITSKTNSVDYGGGFMGLPTEASNLEDSFIAVEFDTSFDPSLGDINDNHIGLDINTVVSVSSIDGYSRGIDLKGEKQMTAWVEYRDGEKMIRVWVGYTRVKPHQPLLVAEIDLSKQLKEFMHVGFSASNSRGSAIHLIDGWRFKTYGILSSVAMPVDTHGEGDCFMCSSHDSGTDEEEDDDDSTSNHHHTDKRLGELILLSGGIAAAIASLTGGVIIAILYRIKKDKAEARGCPTRRFEANKVPKRLSLAEIRSATKGFNQRRIIGEGAAATVYEGSLPSCGTVAVKRFNHVHEIGLLRSQFTAEFGTMVGFLGHKHLVQLQGWCCEGNELILVYEFMANGSLDKYLHKQNNPLSAFLTWDRRLNIILGVASVLVYLHEECERQIIHRDVKTCNIMLDDEFNAKLGDFGLAEVYERSSITREATIPAGTMGYLAPEYVYSGVPNVKTDVYSFGVVILEVVSGKKPVDDVGTLLSDFVWGLWEKGKVTEVVDVKLKGRFNRLEMERLILVGLCCVHPNHEKRPTVKEAARILRGEAPLPVLPSRKPKLRMQSFLPDGSEEIMTLGGETPWGTPRTHF